MNQYTRTVDDRLQNVLYITHLTNDVQLSIDRSRLDSIKDDLVKYYEYIGANPASEYTLQFPVLEEDFTRSLTEFRGLFKRLKGVIEAEQKCSEPAPEVIENEFKKFVPIYFIEVDDSSNLQTLRAKFTEFYTLLVKAKTSGISKRRMNLTALISSFNDIVIVRLLDLIKKADLQLNVELVQFIWAKTRIIEELRTSLSLGGEVTPNTNKDLKLELDKARNEISTLKRALSKNNSSKKANGPLSKFIKPKKQHAAMETAEEKKKYNAKMRDIFFKKNNNKNGFYSSYNLFFNILFKQNNFYKINNISAVTIPDKILKIFSLGSNFIITTDNKSESLIKLEIIKHKIEGYLIKNNITTTYINNEYNKFIKIIESLKSNNNDKKYIRKAKDFLEKNDLIVKYSDKNMGMTIMPLTWYESQIYQHLLDKKVYKEDTINFEKIWEDLEAIIGPLTNFQYKVERLKQKEYTIPFFYVIPKLHKNPICTRPIVPNHSWVTTDIAIWLHNDLWPIVKECQWICENSLDIIHTIDNLSLTSKPHIFSIDVVSMYTNLAIAEGLFIIRKLLLKKGLDEYKVEFRIRLLKWVLTNNYLMYGTKTYKQIKGTAMGSNVAPAFANLFMMFYEELLFEIVPKPVVYKRYLDDILVYTSSEEEFFTLLRHMQDMSPSLKFSYERSTTSINFLDLKLSLSDRITPSGLTNYGLYQKPGTSHLYLHPGCNVPPAIKFGWVTGENIRLIRNCSTKAIYKKELKKFITDLLNRGYTNNIIKKYIKYKYKHRHLLYQPIERKTMENTKFIVLEYDSASKLLKDFVFVLNKHYELNFVLVEKNYEKLIDELNRISVKLLDPRRKLQ